MSNSMSGGASHLSWRDDHDESPDAPKPQRAIRGAQYVRMSTEHQRYSTENQSDAIAQYAVQRGINIVRTYSDVAKLSGLSKRAITQHAANDNIPGAAKHGGVWTFDHDLALLWINEGSKCLTKKKNQKTSSSRTTASIGGSGSRSTASPTESRFAQLLKESRRKKPKAA
jgi:hypothetical protein